MAILLLAGCGGGGGNKGKGTVTGVVFDLNGNPVRGATVESSGKKTVSNSSGSFELSGVTEGHQVVSATTIQDGVNYAGRTTADVFAGDRVSSVNLAVSRRDRLATLTGRVTDVNGNRLGGAKVLAIVNGQSSAIAYTNDNGDYNLTWLGSQVQYRVSAVGRGYDSDILTLTLNPGETRRVNFTLTNSTGSLLNPPTNVAAVAWTSPSEVTRSITAQSAYEAIKRHLDPKRTARAAQSRDTVRGNPIEVDVSWDPVSDPELLGYGVYRARGNGGFSTTFYNRDPQSSFYADADGNLVENQTYRYEVTSLNTEYPDTQNSESDPSTVVSVFTLGDMLLRTPVVGNVVTLRWVGVTNADNYTAVVYDRYPSVGVDPVWPTNGTPTTTGTSLSPNYNFQVGRTYYYAVIGLANGTNSRTISDISSFTY